MARAGIAGSALPLSQILISTRSPRLLVVAPRAPRVPSACATQQDKFALPRSTSFLTADRYPILVTSVAEEMTTLGMRFPSHPAHGSKGKWMALAAKNLLFYRVAGDSLSKLHAATHTLAFRALPAPNHALSTCPPPLRNAQGRHSSLPH